MSLEQGTSEWKRWRAAGIGASDAPVIMGENPWKSEDLLMHEKLTVKLDSPTNLAMQRGTQLEPIALAHYCDKKKLDVEPVCVQSTELPWMKASIDGINFENEIVVEIKCGDSVYRKAAYNRTVPDYYYGQLQHILAVTGFSTIDFWCYLPEKRPILLEVRRNKSYIERLIEKESEFWAFIEKDVLRKLAQSAP